ncbi:putative secretory pathway protein Ssp120 [Coniella lustricola]|uniref:Putative secretory pathway protein Ssp120 n=1 Tax=Coniella lustricola TaxID=2025994 RepID=A0A2T3A3Q4_9PEZI|nr:putative secretory pathway protein Ssp120 [Coniella lustricola]
MLSLIAAVLALSGASMAHGGGEHHGQKPIVDANANWMTKHMAEEHHATDFDASSFFSLHDFNSDGQWESSEIQRTYGLMDDSNKHVPEERRQEIVDNVLALMDTDKDGVVSRAEFTAFIDGDAEQGRESGTLPDFGTGPGHHGDDEYEYEIHHWELYHDENTQLEDLTHPEDIEHFRKHEEMEDEEERLELMKQRSIVEENIPDKFRRTG